MTDTKELRRLASPQEKPICGVHGRIAPGAMCGKVIVGLKYCGAKAGTCPHQVASPQPEKEEG